MNIKVLSKDLKAAQKMSNKSNKTVKTDKFFKPLPNFSFDKCVEMIKIKSANCGITAELVDHSKNL